MKNDLINDFPVRRCFIPGCKKDIDYHTSGFHAYNLLGQHVEETRDNLEYWCCREHTLFEEASALRDLGRKMTMWEKLFHKGFNFLDSGEITICTGPPGDGHGLDLSPPGVCMTCGRPMDKIILDIKLESMEAYAKEKEPTYIFEGEEDWWAERLLTEEEREA